MPWDRTLKATEFCKQSIMGHCGISLEDQNTKNNRAVEGQLMSFRGEQRPCYPDKNLAKLHSAMAENLHEN